MKRAGIVFFALASSFFAQGLEAEVPPAPGEKFWAELGRLCGKSFEGRLAEGTEPSDADFAKQKLVMQVRQCSENEIRIPFHAGDDHSRTWVVMRTDVGFRLKHDHRHEDGSEDAVTWYGGDTRTAGGATSLEFHADAHTAKMLPASASNIWTISIDPGKSFSYGLRRESSGRRFRVEFDLTRIVADPPAPW
ncbi:MAG: hypothetical protein NDJ92_15905 [Thermoanaerobaculia bacterium]|nr:hypothetical protein [Thermoanaerobaculia bacterium]